MQPTLRFLSAALACACLGLPPAASAADVSDNKQTWFGGGIGYGRLDSIDYTHSNGDLAENASSWKVLVGMSRGPVLALDAQFIDFGTVSRAADRTRASAWTAGVILNVPGERRVTPYGKLAVMAWETDSRFNGVGHADSGVDFCPGIGLRFAAMKNLSARLEFEHFAMNNTDVDNVSAALLIAF